MGMFDWIGRNKREAAWMAEPRRLPEGTENIPEGDPAFMVSQEFCIEKSRNIRFYYTARPNEDQENSWVIAKVQYDLKFEDRLDSWDVEWASDPMTVVRTLRQFERRYHNDEKFLVVDGHRSTYRNFANAHGIHFDDKGNIIEVSKDTRLDKGVFMNREALDALFHNAAAKKPLDSWEQIYEQLVNKWPAGWSIAEEVIVPVKTLEPVAEETEAQKPAAPALDAAVDDAAADKADDAVPAAEPVPEPEPVKAEIKVVIRPLLMDDLAKDEKYGAYAANLKTFLTELKDLPAALADPQQNSWSRNNVFRRMLSTVVVTPGFVGDNEKLAQRLTDATMLVGMLRAGAHLYSETLGKGDYSSDNIKLISTIGENCSSFATMRLGVSAEDAKKIADVIASGADPYGPELPLEKTFKAFPPPAYVKPAQQPRRSNGRYDIF